MPTDTFESRVQDLVNEGKLTAEEAAELLGRDATPNRTAGEAPTVPAGEAPPRLFIELTNGDVHVRGRPGLFEPRLIHASRGLVLRATKAGWTVEHHPAPDLASALDWVRAGISTLTPGNLEVEVPEDLQTLEIRSLAGSVDVEEVKAHVRVSLTAGDVDLDGVTGFDVTARTGSVRVRGTIRDGRHRIQAFTGDAELVLDPGSSTELELSTVFGRVNARRMALRSAGLAAKTHDAKVGDGQARVRVETVTGDIDVRTGWEA